MAYSRIVKREDGHPQGWPLLFRSIFPWRLPCVNATPPTPDPPKLQQPCTCAYQGLRHDVAILYCLCHYFQFTWDSPRRMYVKICSAVRTTDHPAYESRGRSSQRGGSEGKGAGYD